MQSFVFSAPIIEHFLLGSPIILLFLEVMDELVFVLKLICVSADLI